MNHHIKHPYTPTKLSKFMLIVGVSLLVLSACTSRPISLAPVEDRTYKPPVANVQSPTPAPNAGYANAKPYSDGNSVNTGKPGYYTVKPGDTVMQVGRVTGQNWRDIVAWNYLTSANQIEVGQVLRVIPPVGVAVATPVNPGASTNINTQPLPQVSTPVVTSPITTPVTVAPPTLAPDDSVAFIWPSNGAQIAGFDEIKNKGLKLAGKLGDAVYAAADGRVVYSGSGLRGYGNLVILKHNDTYLTAYAHNQSLLVKEDQVVKKGQRIADMGSSDAERVMLHFEVRRNGKPVDPAKYLPAR